VVFGDTFWKRCHLKISFCSLGELGVFGFAPWDREGSIEEQSAPYKSGRKSKYQTLGGVEFVLELGSLLSQ
jgi:hypothetical protein